MNDVVAEPVVDIGKPVIDRGPITSPPSPPGNEPTPPVVVEPEKPDTTEADAAAETEKKQTRFNQRMGELVRERHEAQRERDLAKQEAAELRQRLAGTAAPLPEGQAAPLPAGITQADIDRLATQRAQEIVQRQATERAEQERAAGWNKIITTGQEKYTPAAFDAACGDLAALGAGTNRPFIEAISAADNGAAILHHLGTHVEEADRILSLSPTKMAYEIAKLEAKVTAPAPKPVSKAPKPIEPLGGNAAQAGDIYDPSLSPAQFAELRAKQMKAR